MDTVQRPTLPDAERPASNPISGSALENTVDMAMQVRMRLYGVFKSTAGASEIRIEIPNHRATVRSAIERLLSREGLQGLKALLVDSTSSDPRPNALILVSGREINALNGLDTELTEDDELALLPIVHGG